jgi:hypothetical protein
MAYDLRVAWARMALPRLAPPPLALAHCCDHAVALPLHPCCPSQLAQDVRHWQARRMPMVPNSCGADADRSSSVSRDRGRWGPRRASIMVIAVTRVLIQTSNTIRARGSLKKATRHTQKIPTVERQQGWRHATPHDASECPRTPVDAKGAGRTAVRPTAQRFSAPRKSALPLHRTSPHHASHTHAETGP